MWTGGGAPAPCGRPHRKFKLENTDVMFSAFIHYNTIIQLSFEIALLTGSSEVHLHASMTQMQ